MFQTLSSFESKYFIKKQRKINKPVGLRHITRKARFMQKKNQIILAATIIVIVLLGIVAGFSLLNSQPRSSDATLKVLATFYPLYDFAKNVGRDKINVSILVPETVDVHDFDPTPSSIAAVAKADVLIYNGAGLEPLVSRTVKT